MEALGLTVSDMVGQTIYSITGVVKYSWGSYELHPRDASDIVFEAPEVECPEGCTPMRARKLLFGSQPGGMYCPPGCVPMMTGRRLRLD